jgi:hypothetical protein
MRGLMAGNDIYLQVEVFPGAEARLDGRLPHGLKLRAVHGWDRIYSTFDLPAAGERPKPVPAGALSR